MASKNTNIDAMPRVEQFQNMFISQNEVGDKLLNEINVHEDTLAHAAKNNPSSIHRNFFDNQNKMESGVYSFLPICCDFKNQIMIFRLSGC